MFELDRVLFSRIVQYQHFSPGLDQLPEHVLERIAGFLPWKERINASHAFPPSNPAGRIFRLEGKMGWMKEVIPSRITLSRYGAKKKGSVMRPVTFLMDFFFPPPRTFDRRRISEINLDELDQEVYRITLCTRIAPTSLHRVGDAVATPEIVLGRDACKEIRVFVLSFC